MPVDPAIVAWAERPLETANDELRLPALAIPAIPTVALAMPKVPQFAFAEKENTPIAVRQPGRRK